MSARPPWPAAGWPAAALVLLLVLAACAGGILAPRAPAAPGIEPWMLPPAAAPTQRLYRVRYEGPEGKLSFKLSVYLEREGRFRLQASDVLGRKLWALAVQGDGQALWLNHRDETFCHTDARRGLVFIPLTRLPLEAVPRLLLGRLPEPPFDDLRRNETDVSYRDVRGREWTAGLDADGTPERWSLLEDSEPVAWWQRGEGAGESLFSDRRGGQQVRWREVVREPLEGVMPREVVPEGYTQAACDPSSPDRH